MYKLFGIPNCDTVKKARTYLEKNNIDYEFVDFKKSPPTSDLIESWSKKFPGLPVNTKGTTYKKYKEEYEKMTDSKKVAFLCSNPSMIKRPILMKAKTTLSFGFDSDNYDSILG